MNNKLVQELKKYCCSLRDSNGLWYSEPIGIVKNAQTSSDGINRVKTILNIVLNSDKISDETKIYISSMDFNIKDVNEKINELRANATKQLKRKVTELSYNNTLTKISNDNQRLKMIFGDSIIRDCVYNRLTDFSQLDSLIDRLILEFGQCEKSRGNLMIDIEKTSMAFNGYNNNEEFFDILSSIEGYLIQRKMIIEKAINSNSDFVSYFNYLLSDKGITDERVSVDRERLLRFLNNEDYKTGFVDDYDL